MTEYLPKEKKCTKCHKIKLQFEFNLNKNHNDGLSYQCKYLEKHKD